MSIKKNKKGKKVNKFAEWMKNNEKTQRGVAKKLGISTSTLHDILRKDQMPSLKVAYEIERYTHGDVTIYDWLDNKNSDSPIDKKNTKPKPKAITR